MTTLPATPTTLQARVSDFLAQRRIAVAGVSARRETPGNLIYRKLKGAGYQVFAISHTSATFDGDACYPDVRAIPGGVDGIVIATRPAATTELVRQCAEAGVPRVWLHESMLHGGTSISPEAVALCQEHGMMLIAGACPLMYCAPVDFGHRCMRWMMQVTGGMPK